MCVPCNCNNHSERCNSMNGACQVIDHSFLYRHDVRRYHTYRCRENRNLFICIYVFIYRTVSIILWECIVKDVSRATTEMPPLECKVTVRSEEFSCLPYCILYLPIASHCLLCILVCRCPCPLTIPSNSFSATCRLEHRTGEAICLQCPPGYEGSHCEL